MASLTGTLVSKLATFMAPAQPLAVLLLCARRLHPECGGGGRQPKELPSLGRFGLLAMGTPLACLKIHGRRNASVATVHGAVWLAGLVVIVQSDVKQPTLCGLMCNANFTLPHSFWRTAGQR